MSDFETVPVGTMDKLKAVEEERDALVAHVKAWRHGMTLIEGWANSDAEGNQGDAKEWLRHLRDWINQHSSDDSPTTSLARQKAEWQAEALERYSRIITEEWIDKGESYGLRTASGQALLQAKGFRRQAEEAQ